LIQAQHYINPYQYDEVCFYDHGDHSHRSNNHRDNHCDHDDHSHHHEHDDHGHHHDERPVIEQTAIDREVNYKENAGHSLGRQFAEIFIRVVIKNQIVTPEEIRMVVERVETMGSNSEGARIVARAWCDSEFKARLLENANSACLELGIVASNSHASTILRVVENTDTTHNLIVCTLCSCYPLNILGISPSWYKSRSYRSRAVRDPRILLKEFGTIVPDDKIIRVHDSTSDLRFMVLPQRPKGTELLNQEELIPRVTRDSMIGVTVLS